MKHKWPHQHEPHPHKCRNCLNSLESRGFTQCLQTGVVYMSNSEFVYCKHYTDKSKEMKERDAKKKTKQNTKPQKMAQGSKSPQKKSDTNARRIPPIGYFKPTLSKKDVELWKEFNEL